MKINKETLKRNSAYTLFWSWHIIYTILALFLVIPYLLAPMVTAAIDSQMPWHYLIYIMLIAGLPFISMYLGVNVFYKDYRKLMKYFYGFEMSMLFFLLIRMLTFRDFNPVVLLLIANITIALGTWLYFLWREDENRQLPEKLQKSLPALAGATIIALVGLYFGAMLVVYMLPLAIEFILGFFEGLFRLLSRPFDLFFLLVNPLVWLAAIFILFSMSLFIALPVVMVWLYVGQFKRFIPNVFQAKRLATVLSIIFINIVIFSSASQQPQQSVFDKIDNAKSESELVAQSEWVREGLLNAYLSPYRYTSSIKDSNTVSRNYKEAFGLSNETSQVPQSIFNTLASPFLYQSNNHGWSDVEKAAKYYENFFDAPIQKAERESILTAITRTWEFAKGNEAGLLSAENHVVHVSEQDIQVTQEKGIATINISQTLENLTYQNQEAVIHFSLPEDAVITGIWLSDEPRNPKKYVYALAPKGAAQSVYKSEVNRRVDPALLEKVGPYQYRLRAYPVLPKPTELGKTAPLFVQFEYQTLQNPKTNNWFLPIVLEKRNIFWDNDTKRTINDTRISMDDDNQWIPPQLASTQVPRGISKAIYYQGGKQLEAKVRSVSNPLTIKAKLAVLIDGSYSMIKNKPSVLSAIKEIKASRANYQLYFCRKKCSQLKSSDTLESVSFFGNTQIGEQLSAFSDDFDKTNVSAVIVLTDSGSYEIESEIELSDLNITTPVWLVHLGNHLPYAYDDKVLDLIYRSKGGVSQSVNDALYRYNAFSNTQEQNNLVSVSQYRDWYESDNTDGSAVDDNQPIQKIAAAQTIKYLAKTMNIQKLDNLDNIHSYAKKNGIITHYSSMLVLVNDRQKEALKKAEQADDRFDRETETGKQDTSFPDNPLAVTAVPEPEEWALLAIIGVILSIAIIRRRRADQNVYLGSNSY